METDPRSNVTLRYPISPSSTFGSNVPTCEGICKSIKKEKKRKDKSINRKSMDGRFRTDFLGRTGVSITRLLSRNWNLKHGWNYPRKSAAILLKHLISVKMSGFLGPRRWIHSGTDIPKSFKSHFLGSRNALSSENEGNIAWDNIRSCFSYLLNVFLVIYGKISRN